MDMEEMDRRLEERYANARKGSTGGGKRVLL
jgi:hypothetical protein